MHFLPLVFLLARATAYIFADLAPAAPAPRWPYNSPPHNTYVLPASPLQTLDGTRSGRLVLPGSLRPSAASGSTSTVAASRRRRCVCAMTWQLRRCIVLVCVNSSPPTVSPSFFAQDARFYTGTVPLTESFECVIAGGAGAYVSARARARNACCCVSSTFATSTFPRLLSRFLQQQGQGPHHLVHGQAHARPGLRRLIPQAAP